MGQLYSRVVFITPSRHIHCLAVLAPDLYRDVIVVHWLNFQLSPSEYMFLSNRKQIGIMIRKNLIADWLFACGTFTVPGSAPMCNSVCVCRHMCMYVCMHVHLLVWVQHRHTSIHRHTSMIVMPVWCHPLEKQMRSLKFKTGYKF